MPHIAIISAPHEGEPEIIYRERVMISDLDSGHFAGQLIERIGWALVDAERAETGEEKK